MIIAGCSWAIQVTIWKLRATRLPRIPHVLVRLDA